MFTPPSLASQPSSPGLPPDPCRIHVQLTPNPRRIHAQSVHMHQCTAGADGQVRFCLTAP